MKSCQPEAGGGWASLLDLDREVVTQLIREVFAKKQSAIDSNLEAVELLADAHVQLGKAAMSQSDWELALSHFDNALGGAPQSVEALNARAQLLMRLGRFAEAESALLQLLQIVGESPTLLLVYGDALYQNSKGEQARSSWQRAQALLGSGAADPRLRQALTERLGR